MKEIEKEFYAHLGLLSIQFARMEQMLHLIAAGLLGADKFVSKTVIQNNNLTVNLNLVKKLNEFREIDINKMHLMIKQIEAIKDQRNLFIHAVWFEPYEQNGGIQITCSDMKVISTKTMYGKGWVDQTHYTFDLDDIKIKIEKLKEIQEIEKALLEQIKKLTFTKAKL
jgi:hypothetical protein